MHEYQIKELEWLGTTLREVREFPEDIRRGFGFSLYEVQIGKRPVTAKTYAGAVQELRESDDQNRTYRLVYIASFEEAVYVLHTFVKKSKRGIATSKIDQELIEKRFAEATRLHGERTKS